MAKYEVFPNSSAHARTTPYLLDVQSDLLDGLESRMVIPLRRLQSLSSTTKRPERLFPTLQIGDETFLLDVPSMGAVPIRILKHPVASLASKHDSIAAAIDFLFQGI